VDSQTTIPDRGESAARPTIARPSSMAFRLTMASLWTIVILVLCWMPREWVEEVEDSSGWLAIPDLDKVVHWGIFVVFAVLWLRLGSSRWRYLWVGLGGLAVAVVSEIVQTVPWIGRDGSLDDAITDMIGTLMGMVVARWVEPWLRRWEARLFRDSNS
jgi:hypothetical protein